MRNNMQSAKIRWIVNSTRWNHNGMLLLPKGLAKKSETKMLLEVNQHVSHQMPYRVVDGRMVITPARPMINVLPTPVQVNPVFNVPRPHVDVHNYVDVPRPSVNVNNQVPTPYVAFDVDSLRQTILITGMVIAFAIGLLAIVIGNRPRPVTNIIVTPVALQPTAAPVGAIKPLVPPTPSPAPMSIQLAPITQPTLAPAPTVTPALQLVEGFVPCPTKLGNRVIVDGVKGDGLTLRQKPARSADKLANVPDGTTFDLDEHNLCFQGPDGLWVPVVWNGQPGYLTAVYLRATP